MKNNNEENEEQKPSKIKLFGEYYKNVPGFKALVKLFLYFIFFAVIISVVACNQETVKQNNKEEKTEEKEKVTLTYQEMLDALTTNNSKILYNITIGEESYRIDATYQDKILSGMFRTKDTLHEFKIQNNLVYEIGLNEEKENATLFTNINITYLVPESLVNILENNKAIKMLEDDTIVYNYEIDGSKYRVVTKDNEINKIEITSTSFSYIIEYSKSEVK